MYDNSVACYIMQISIILLIAHFFPDAECRRIQVIKKGKASLTVIPICNRDNTHCFEWILGEDKSICECILFLHQHFQSV